MKNYELKTTRYLYSPDKAFRIEKRKVINENMFDIIWQANGESEEIFMMVDSEDLKKLKKDINKLI